MGYLVLAKGHARIYLWTELAYNVLHALLVWICIQAWGLAGVGVAFFSLYVCYCSLMWVVTRRLTGFGWSSRNRRLAVVALPSLVLAFLGSILLPPSVSVVAIGVLTIAAGLYSFRMLQSLPLDEASLGGLRAYLRPFRRTRESAAVQ
jgi:PST family polysaccharide transporter